MSAVPGTPDLVQRTAPLGLRFWDVAAATSVVDGLQVEVYLRTRPATRWRVLPNRSAVYVAHHLPGMRAFEFDEADPAQAVWQNLADASPSLVAGYRIEVRDPQGRFLPLAFDAQLPARGLLALPAPWLSPPSGLIDAGAATSPPMIAPIPLFSAPGRPVPEPLAVVRAQLRQAGAAGPAAWALLEARVDDVTVGFGMADREG